MTVSYFLFARYDRKAAVLQSVRDMRINPSACQTRLARIESLFQMVFILGPNRKRAVGRITQSWSRPQSDSRCSSPLRFDSCLSCGTVPVFLPRLAHACHVWQPSEAVFSAEGLGFYARQPCKGRQAGRQWWNGHIKSINPCSGAGLSDTLLDWFLIRFVWTLAPPSRSAG